MKWKIKKVNIFTDINIYQSAFFALNNIFEIYMSFVKPPDRAVVDRT